MATSTIPPEPMLSKKFFSDGESPPDSAAWATSGTTMEAVRAAAVSPVTTFSFMEALTWNFLASLVAGIALEGLTGNGLRNEHGVEQTLFWVNGIDMDTAEVEAIVGFW